MAILKRGLAGEPVKRLQEKLGIEVDGQFGPKTEKALKGLSEAVRVDGRRDCRARHVRSHGLARVDPLEDGDIG
jgi:lysozyme family protein